MSESEEKPTPPVPATDSFVYEPGDAPCGVKVIERNVHHCPCGGAYQLERVFTGKMVVDIWDSDRFDSDQFALEDEHPHFEDRQRCRRCGAEVYF